MEYKRPSVKKPAYKRDPMPQYKWSKLKNYPNGSKNIFHLNRQGKIIVHLNPHQTLNQYWNIFGKFPAPVVLVPVPKNNGQAAYNARKEKFAPIRRALNELHKPWAIEQNSLNRKLAGEIHIIVRQQDKNVFMRTLEKLGRGNRPALNSPGRGNAEYNFSSGLKILLRFTSSENFKKSIKIVNRTTPVISYKNF